MLDHRYVKPYVKSSNSLFPDNLLLHKLTMSVNNTDMVMFKIIRRIFKNDYIDDNY